jgi:hypothetical protein
VAVWLSLSLSGNGNLAIAMAQPTEIEQNFGLFAAMMMMFFCFSLSWQSLSGRNK